MAYESENIAAAYKTLGLTPGVSPLSARRRYRELIKESHPDKFPHDSATQAKAVRVTQEINKAYETIKRAAIHHEVPLWRPTPAKQRVSKNVDYVDGSTVIDRIGIGVLALLLGLLLDFSIGSELAVVWIVVPLAAGAVGFIFGVRAIEIAMRVLWWLS